MSEVIHVQIDRADGSLQRLIGLVERRGFHIDGLILADEGALRRVQMRVRGRDDGRCTENLGRQIDRLYGCSRVAGSVSAFPAEAAA